MRIDAPRGGCAPSSFHNDERGDDLADHRRDRGAEEPEPRRAKEPEDQDRIERDIDKRAENLRDGRQAHVPFRLQNLRPHTLEEDPETSDADESSVNQDVANHQGRVRLRRGVLRHEEPRRDGEENPHDERQRSRDARVFPRGAFVPFPELRRDEGVDADARADRKGEH